MLNVISSRIRISEERTMNKMEYTINCLDGTYELTVEYDDTVIYSVDTNIETMQSFSGELDADQSKAFIEEIKKAGIERWDREYNAELSEIEDGITWQMRYLRDGKEYVSKGVESYQPYGYEHLVNAIQLLDEKSGYLL